MNNQLVNITEAQQDAQAIFSLLDDLVGNVGGSNPAHSDAPLTATEQDRLAMFLGEEASAQPVPLPTFSPPKGLERANDLSLNTLGEEIEGLFSELQRQLETMIAQHASLSQELEATRSRIEAHETTLETKVPQVVSSQCTVNAKDLRTVFERITHWRTLFANQFEQLLTLAKDSMTQQQQLESALAQANQSIQELQNKLNTHATAKQGNSEVITPLRAGPGNQSTLQSAAEVRSRTVQSNHEQVEQILKKLKARLGKKPESTVTLHLKVRRKKKPALPRESYMKCSDL